ncbi:hypothetical protein prwr041_05030 [Prevotella herbatica]|uniref:Uncharacterized protein n=1 Tax=Prevotella herbatica TaxID=2801997 RepID=A0ABM7NVX6_9BACT|nr:hypothetical protein prwr041_05030 [Prevotella herbatica]
MYTYKDCISCHYISIINCNSASTVFQINKVQNSFKDISIISNFIWNNRHSRKYIKKGRMGINNSKPIVFYISMRFILDI